jgi:glycosyltransferase involved in cell wall biosynthesis
VIDVLLPFYGDPALMRLSVESVLAQSSRDLRLVVVDDGYPDPSIEPWFAGLADDRVEYHRNAANLGANRNYTRALELARAEHVVIMGADDVMLPNYLSVIEDALARFPGASIVECGVDVIDGDGTVVRPLVDRVKAGLTPRQSRMDVLSGERAMVALLRGNWTYFPSLCWRTEAIRQIGFRPEFHVVQDMALLMDVLLREGNLVMVPEVAFQYRRHAGSDSSVKTVTGNRFAEERVYFRHIADELRERGLSRAARAARVHATSRLHAASLIPVAARSRDLGAVGRLLRHAAG